jgi:cell wall assembly regulator SMI1
MKKQLEVLDDYLKEFRPDFYLNLNAALKDEEIKALEKKFKITIPSDLKELYKWKNGQSSFHSFVNNSMFMPLEEALASAQECTSMIGYDFDIDNWWNEHWIPIFHNGGGDHICYDIGGAFTGEQGQLIEFWHADNDRNIIAPNLKSFIEGINKLYKTAEDDEYSIIQDIKEMCSDLESFNETIKKLDKIIEFDENETFIVQCMKGFPKKFYVE